MDGTEGLQDGLKKVKLSSGKVLEADYVFIGNGDKPNVSLVDKADPGALVAGLVGVSQYLKVSTRVLPLDEVPVSAQRGPSNPSLAQAKL